MNSAKTVTAVWNMSAPVGSGSVPASSNSSSNSGSNNNYNNNEEVGVSLPNQSNVVYYQLSVTKRGTGSGAVSSDPSASPVSIYCGSDCNDQYNSGYQTYVVASPARGSNFIGWSGCSSVQGNICNVTMNGNKTVTATFDAITPIPTRSLEN